VVGLRCVSLLSDYGLEDGFVAACHGVLARIAPDVRIIDITHLVPPGDVRRGATVLAQTVPYLPAGIHVAVVDPGRAGSRRGVAVAAGERIFVGPDNGVLSWAVRGESGPVQAYELTNAKLWLEPVSATFRGRDVYAPVAAHLATGFDLAAVGPPLDPDRLTALSPPVRRVRAEAGAVEGEVLSTDRFGNVQLSVTVPDLQMLGTGAELHVTVGRRKLVVPFRDSWAAVAPGELVAYADAAGCIALAVNSGNAAQLLALPPGARVRVGLE
jgi:S-adenosylmethionine hydrolase